MNTPAPQIEATRPARPKGGRRALGAFVVLAAVALGIFLYGEHRFSTGPATGEGSSGTFPAIPPNKTVFRVGTFNMHSGIGEDDVYNLSRTIDSVRETDLCALNEVRGRLFAHPQNQAEEIAQSVQSGWIYLPSERRFWHDDFGNGILTRLPVKDWIRLPLPTDPVHGGLRNATLLDVDFAGRLVHVLVTHIDRKQDQPNQLRFVTRLFDSLQPPSLLLGDLNADSDNHEIQALLALPNVNDCIGQATGQPRNRIDWILSRGFHTTGGEVVQKHASDHPMYWVDLELAP